MAAKSCLLALKQPNEWCTKNHLPVALWERSRPVRQTSPTDGRTAQANTEYFNTRKCPRNTPPGRKRQTPWPPLLIFMQTVSSHAGQGLQIQHVFRPLPGGSRSRQVLASDGRIYCVKNPNNPQTVSALAAEWIATSLMAKVGAPVPIHNLIHECDGAIPSLAIAYPVDPRKSIIHDILAPESAHLVGNLDALVGAFVLDRWLANADRRQAVYFRKTSLLQDTTANIEGDLHRPSMRLLLIDQGACFNGPEWNFKVGPRHSKVQGEVWRQIPNRSQILESWIARVRNLSVESLAQPLMSVPSLWLPSTHDYDRFILELDRRREKLADLVDEASSAQLLAA